MADIDALRQYYAQKFQESAIPKNPNVEEIEKARLESALEAATRNTSKGEYHKTRQASQVLGRLNVDRIRNAAPNCDRLFTTLAQIMEETI